MSPAMAQTDIPLHGFTGLEVDPGPPAVATVPLTEAVRGAFVPLHGGMYAALADVACAAALATEIDLAEGYPVTTDLSIRFFAQPKEGPVTAEAQLVHRGRRLAGAECVVRDGLGRQLARASATFVMLPSA
jgi:uncharacterized protein (TIGR00369 family)